MFIRIVSALSLAVLVTLGLFILMHSLIELGRVKLGDDSQVWVADFIRLRHESQTQLKKRELPQKQQAEKQPEPPSFNIPKSQGPDTDAVAIAAPAPSVDTSVRLAGGPTLGTAASDAEVVPLVRIQPMYPRSAAERRIEGWVLVEFVISKKGTVKNPCVIESNPPNVFDRVALDAIRKWKYKPKIENGVPVETWGVQVRLTFKLDEM